MISYGVSANSFWLLSIPKESFIPALLSRRPSVRQELKSSVGACQSRKGRAHRNGLGVSGCDVSRPLDSFDPFKMGLDLAPLIVGALSISRGFLPFLRAGAKEIDSNPPYNRRNPLDD